MYTVKQLSDIAGISRRTIHYYDQIGLLPPSEIAANGYRYYSDKDLSRLQQVLFYREAGCSLRKIKNILDEPEFDIKLALLEHKRNIKKQQAHLEILLKAVDQTLAYQKGDHEMSPKQLFDAFNEKEQIKYEKEAMRKYDPSIVSASNIRWKNFTKEQKQHNQDQGNTIYQDIVKCIQLGPASPEAQQCIEQWRMHITNFWTPSLDQLIELASLYNDDPRFKENFDNLDPRLAEFMLKAVRFYVSCQRNNSSD